jgi:hypothetical protein
MLQTEGLFMIVNFIVQATDLTYPPPLLSFKIDLGATQYVTLGKWRSANQTTYLSSKYR